MISVGNNFSALKLGHFNFYFFKVIQSIQNSSGSLLICSFIGKPFILLLILEQDTIEIMNLNLS